MKTRFFCFGNEFISIDSLAKQIVSDIERDNIFPDVEFIYAITPEELFAESGKNIYIIDVVSNIKSVLLIEDIDYLTTLDIKTLHDFDLAYFLKIMKKIGQISEVKIIGIPQKGDLRLIKKDVIRIISYLKKSASHNPRITRG